MTSGISISLSGLANAVARLNLTANNIANRQTAGYQALRADNVETAGGGVRIGAITADPSPAPPQLDSSGTPLVQGSNVDPSVEQVNLLLNRRQFEANLAALKALDNTLGTTLRIVQ